MPTHQLDEAALRDALLTVLNQRRHWVLVPLDEAGRKMVGEVGRRFYPHASADVLAYVIPGPMLGGKGLMSVVALNRERCSPRDLVGVLGEFADRPPPGDELAARRLIALGAMSPEQQMRILQALDRWLCARRDYAKVGLE